MIKEHLGDRLDAWIHRALPFLFRRPIDPDLLTVVGTLVAGSAGLAFAHGRMALGGGLLIAGGFFDLVDGVIARHFGITTRFGAFLDSTLDRLVDMAAMLGLVVYFADRGEATGVGLASVILIASVLTSYAKARAETIIERLPGGLLERGERIGALALGALLGILEPVLWVLALGTVVTAGQRFLYAWREMNRLDREARPSPLRARPDSGEAGDA